MLADPKQRRNVVISMSYSNIISCRHSQTLEMTRLLQVPR